MKHDPRHEDLDRVVKEINIFANLDSHWAYFAEIMENKKNGVKI